MTPQFNRFHSIALSALLIGSLTAPMVAMAQSEPSAQPAKAGKHYQWDGKRKEAHQQFMKDLNLTDQQKQQLKAAHEKFRQENAGTIENMKAKRAQLKALSDDPAKEAQRQQLKAEMKQGRQAMMAQKKASMQGILTPDQQARWDAKKAEHKAKWQEKHAKRHANPQPSP